MNKKIAIIVLFIIPIIFFKSFFLQNFLPIPSDTIVGLYYPFRDLYASTNPNGVPFKNFLITDPVRQQVPWRALAITAEKQITLPLWNPYSLSGYPLLGNMQSGVFYPINLIFFLFPFTFSWSMLIFLQPLLAGFFLFLYLQNKKLALLPSLLGAVSFAFCGYFVSWMQW